MAFGGHLGFGYLRLHAELFLHTRKRIKRHIFVIFHGVQLVKNIILKMASGGHLGYGYLRSS